MLVHGGVVAPRTGQEALVRVPRDLRGRSRAKPRAKSRAREAWYEVPSAGLSDKDVQRSWFITELLASHWVGETLVSGAEAGLPIGFGGKSTCKQSTAGGSNDETHFVTVAFGIGRRHGPGFKGLWGLLFSGAGAGAGIVPAGSWVEAESGCDLAGHPSSHGGRGDCPIPWRSPGMGITVDDGVRPGEQEGLELRHHSQAGWTAISRDAARSVQSQEAISQQAFFQGENKASQPKGPQSPDKWRVRVEHGASGTHSEEALIT
ncbi:hypothetical protein TrVGV298_003981 [Trichoderma virens]|nr:hypothetical protein TrVGV298_003981 [Trichoderma virens]